jgi:hypothetical protein
MAACGREVRLPSCAYSGAAEGAHGLTSQRLQRDLFAGIKPVGASPSHLLADCGMTPATIVKHRGG